MLNKTRIYSLTLFLFSFASTARLDAAPIDTLAYLRLFLTQSDLPGMKNDQDSRKKGADSEDTSYRHYHGQIAGMNIWNSKSGTDTIYRLVDIHWVFPDAESAKSYLNQTWDYQSEGSKFLEGAPKVGEMSRVYGMSMNMGKFSMIALYYLFQEGRVVTKLFVTQGPELTKPVLFQKTQGLAEKLMEKIHKSGL